MPSNSALCDHVAPQRPRGGLTTKVKSVLRGLVASKSRSKCARVAQIELEREIQREIQVESPTESQKETRPRKLATNRHGKILEGAIFLNPLYTHYINNDNDSSSTDNTATCRSEINRYIWGASAGPSDEDDVLVNRVHAMLQLENNPVLEYLEHEGGSCDLGALPREVRRSLERVIAAQI